MTRHTDPSTIRRVATWRLEPSPYHHLYANESTVLGIYAGRTYATWNGEDPLATYWALRRGVALYDVPERPWQIEGPDVVPFLERVFARPVADLATGRGRYAIACDHQGGTFMDGILFKLAEGRYWYVQPDGQLEAWLVAHAEGYDVTISDPGSRVLQVQGPRSMEVMGSLTGGALDASMKYFHSGFFDIGGQRLYVSRTGWTGELGYEIYSDRSIDHDRLWSDVMAAGRPHAMAFGGTASMSMRRIEAGILDNLSDFDRSMTPFEAGLGAFVDLSHEGFIGREALIEADRRVRLLGVRCSASMPKADGVVADESGRSVGRITASTWSPTLEVGIGFVRFDTAGDWIGRSLTVETADGPAPCEVTSLPFLDPDKRIPRGLTAD